ncbi:DUF397 domain-containing protein [Streptantibioticus rubrisoli]|uniref:DUF397 domain-containing protein n=1 Tax=Streptantibioticus rubrisoli TaxID=1387313 RepID=A0ABT1PJF1_9ACTN|nr:DUF397 domain-containing protein [Streptantibioticus rubrisoli]MCQ4045490.1 DUF397 domain-containing protein [Streptantibioticus rubrisoli]
MPATRIDLTTAYWRKSSYSNVDGGECVEVADNVPGHIPVRDSKDPQGPTLLFTAEAWNAFVRAVKSGRWA